MKKISIKTKSCNKTFDEGFEQFILSNIPNKPKHHLMWNKMKLFIRKRKIELEGAFFELNDLLDEWYDLRNKSAHGEEITKDDYKIISKYKNQGLFEAISQKKMDLKNISASPTMDEIADYMGLEL